MKTSLHSCLCLGRGSILLAIVLAALAMPATAQIYKWVDEKGRTHYGEKPPEGVKAKEVGAPTPPPSGAAAPQPDWKQKELEAQRRRIEQNKKETTTSQQSARSETARAQACADAKADLEQLQMEIPLYKRDAKGERVYMEDKDRAERIAKSQRFIRDNCGS